MIFKKLTVFKIRTLTIFAIFFLTTVIELCFLYNLDL